MIDIKHVEKYIRELFSDKLNKHYTYHSLEHTLDVVSKVKEYSLLCEISKLNCNLLEVAAWFHDTGFTIDHIEHEALGVEIFNTYIEPFKLAEEDVSFVQKAILVTKIPQQPNTIFEKIICDADLDYLGRSDFEKISPLLFSEWVNIGKLDQGDDDTFNTIQVQFLSKHSYHLDAVKALRDKGKAKNLRKVKRLISKKS